MCGEPPVKLGELPGKFGNVPGKLWIPEGPKIEKIQSHASILIASAGDGPLPRAHRYRKHFASHSC